MGCAACFVGTGGRDDGSVAILFVLSTKGIAMNLDMASQGNGKKLHENVVETCW
jgi:hypothetical protein